MTAAIPRHPSSTRNLDCTGIRPRSGLMFGTCAQNADAVGQTSRIDVFVVIDLFCLTTIALRQWWGAARMPDGRTSVALRDKLRRRTTCRNRVEMRRGTSLRARTNETSER